MLNSVVQLPQNRILSSLLPVEPVPFSNPAGQDSSGRGSTHIPLLRLALPPRFLLHFVGIDLLCIHRMICSTLCKVRNYKMRGADPTCNLVWKALPSEIMRFIRTYRFTAFSVILNRMICIGYYTPYFCFVSVVLFYSCARVEVLTAEKRKSDSNRVQEVNVVQ